MRYLLFRLKSAGAGRGIFSRQAAELLYEHSGGIPLRINNLCDRCLLIGLMHNVQVVDSRIMRDAMRTWELDAAPTDRHRRRRRRASVLLWGAALMLLASPRAGPTLPRRRVRPLPPARPPAPRRSPSSWPTFTGTATSTS